MSLLHCQGAACGRPSPGTIEAVADHLRREATEGGYVAQEAAEPTLAQARADAGALLGHDGDGVFWTTGATDSLGHLLQRWRLPAGSEVAVTPGEWGPNLEQLHDRGLVLRTLVVDPDGRLDLDRLEHLLRTAPPAAVHLVQLASHRALEQPVAAALELCRAAGVPLWVDAAQAFAHRPTPVDADGLGADAVYAPARKWLSAPRGVGFLAIAPRWREPFAGLGRREASIASRVGAGQALTELEPDHARRLADVGDRLRAALADVPDWELADPPGALGALIGLRPTAGQDVEAEQHRLLEDHRILTTACLPWRAPGDMSSPLLRIAASQLGDRDVQRLTSSLTMSKHPPGRLGMSAPSG